MAKRMREKSAKRLENRDTRPTATARYVRMGAPKAKRLLDLIKNKSAVEACALDFFLETPRNEQIPQGLERTTLLDKIVAIARAKIC